MKKRLLCSLLTVTLCLAEVISVSATTVSENAIETQQNETKTEVERTTDVSEEENPEAENASEIFLLKEENFQLEEGVAYEIEYIISQNVDYTIRIVNKTTHAAPIASQLTTKGDTDFSGSYKTKYFTISKDQLPVGDYEVQSWIGHDSYEAANAAKKVDVKPLQVRKSIFTEHNKNMSAIVLQNAVYTGQEVLPNVILTETVNGNTYTLSLNKDYKLTVVSENKSKMGAAKVKIEGIGNYAGTKELDFMIAPQTPAIAAITSLTANSVKVTWKKADYAQGYYIDRKAKDGSFFNVAKVTNGDTVSFTDDTAGLVVGETYQYRVRSYAASAVEADKEAVSTPDEVGASVRVIPSTPEAVSLESISVRKMKLTWKQVNDADGYVIYRVNKGNLTKVKDIKSADKVSYEIGKLSTGYIYQYCLKAYKKNPEGKAVLGEASNILKARVTLKTPVLDSVKSVSSTENQVKWKRVANAYGYYIYRKDGTDKNAKYKKIATIKDGTVVTYHDKKASTGKKYVYTVKAYTKAKVNGKTRTLTSACDKNGISGTAVPPKTVFVLKQVEKGVQISIANSQGATGYYLYRKKGNEKWIRKSITSQGGDCTVYVDEDITANTEYQYYIIPYKKIPGNIVKGVASDTIKFKTK